MTTNGAAGRASSVASNSSNLVDASGYKFSEKDTKPGKIKLKKQASGKAAKPGNKSEPQGNDADAPGSPDGTPVLPEMDAKTMTAFPSGKPREDELETVICKHCKRPQLKQTAAEHIRGCLKAKQEKARKKKEARDAKNQAKVADKDVDDKDDDKDDDGVSGQKSAKKSAVKGMADDGPKKGKKRKADAEDEKDKEPKKKKKKEEPKPKVPKPKGPVDVEKQCGVPLPNGAQCARSLTCKSHSMGAKRAVPGRSLPYDMLLQAYQKKNQARQQKAAIDANAPLQDELENNGPVDSDEERDSVMAAIARSHPTPLVTHTLVPMRKKYHYVRMKEMLSNVLGGVGGGSLFSTNQTNGDSRGFFQMESPTVTTATVLPDTSDDPSKKSTNAQAAANRSSNTAPTKTAVAATS
ncbi:SCA7, zinc-binding domain-containing protein [Talaromyces proteolyticus]|uniref:SCA7, zinc-binding domain-containing protein n=1 Tax=Talaromyces proteolyticus TaxID=1131652 RepID=A0AAD4KQH0_9EURO|nr:SCA7, zinc-binding domain-containing protein [Talaromyces proteolyticus]KAH8696077.1 SCA7, zinc-binding domain-containing protein [Talaromyces proteolyticus]